MHNYFYPTKEVEMCTADINENLIRWICKNTVPFKWEDTILNSLEFVSFDLCWLSLKWGYMGFYFLLNLTSYQHMAKSLATIFSEASCNMVGMLTPSLHFSLRHPHPWTVTLSPMDNISRAHMMVGSRYHDIFDQNYTGGYISSNFE